MFEGNAHGFAYDTRSKLKRSGEHLGSLDKELRAFFESGPYAIDRQYDPEDALFTFRVEVAWDIPVGLGLIAGDAAHNMRSTLDAFVWELALPEDGEQDRRIEFPIFLKCDKIASAGIRRKIWAVAAQGPGHYTVASTYQRGEWAEVHPLWILHKFDIAGKHKVVPAVGCPTHEWACQHYAATCCNIR